MDSSQRPPTASADKPDPELLPVSPPQARGLLPGAPSGFAWALIPLVFGVLLLLGGAVAAVLLTLRGGVSLSGPAAGSPGVAGSARSAPRTPVLRAPSLRSSLPPAPEATEDVSQTADFVPLPAGAATQPQEATALLPLLAGELVWGLASAPTTLALFGDLECVHTRRALRGMLGMQATRGGDVRFVFHHRPAEGQALSRLAARIVVAATLRAGAEAGFRLLARAAASTTPLSAKELQKWFEDSGGVGAVSKLESDRLVDARLIADARLAAELDVRATPTVFVNGRRIEGWPANALEEAFTHELRSVTWLRAQGVLPAQTYARRLRENLIRVPSGVPDRFCVPTEGAPSQGARGAPVTLVEFSDFECEHCRRLQPALVSVLKRHPGQLRRVWRSFALPQHRRAPRIAAFALAARRAGGERVFWTVHDALMGIPNDADDQQLRHLAERLSLNADALFAEAESPEASAELASHQAISEGLGLGGTPTLFINGQRLSGAVPEEALEAVVKVELEAAKRILRNGTPVSEFADLLCLSPRGAP